MAKQATTPRSKVYSVRVGTNVWEAAKVRAEAEDKPLNAVISDFIEGYALGKIKAPQTVKKYG